MTDLARADTLSLRKWGGPGVPKILGWPFDKKSPKSIQKVYLHYVPSSPRHRRTDEEPIPVGKKGKKNDLK